MTANPPTFGPTETFPCDENSEPFAVVALNVTVTREQLRAMLAIGHAEQAGQPPLPALTIIDTRREIEGYLAAAAIFASDGELQAVNARLSLELAAELDAAINQAYTHPELQDPPRQSPHYRDGTVTLQTLDHGEVTVDEPAWCLGHDNEPVGYLVDLTHNGRPITTHAATASEGPIEVAHGFISHAPQRQAEPHPTLHVALDLNQPFDPEDGRNLVRALRVAANRFERAFNDLAHLRGEGQ